MYKLHKTKLLCIVFPDSKKGRASLLGFYDSFALPFIEGHSRRRLIYIIEEFASDLFFLRGERSSPFFDAAGDGECSQNSSSDTRKLNTANMMKIAAFFLTFLVGTTVATEVCTPDARALFIADKDDACLKNEVCRGIVTHWAGVAVNSGLYDDGWYLNENGGWTNATAAEAEAGEHRLLRGGERKLESYRCEWCIEGLGWGQFICAAYGYCRRRQLTDTTEPTFAEKVQHIQDSCYKDVGVSYDAWLYTAMKWLADNRYLANIDNAHDYIKGITYRVQKRKTNEACTVV
eukprot:scaffold6485_cov172-Amphora_coffeaeformis.AAC.7